MTRKIGILFIILGIAALLAAAGLVFYNNWESQTAMEASNSVLEQMRQQELSGPEEDARHEDGNYRETGTAQDETVREEQSQSDETADATEDPYADYADTFDEAAKEMTTVTIGGYDYIGYLSIPVLELELPVMSEWDYERLRRAPCRQFGSTKTDDLVIAAHNYPAHFGYLSQLRSGDLLTFTDMDTDVILYEVAVVDVLEPTAVDAVKNSDFDLVLYTCTYGGEKRVAVFCNRIKQ